MRSPFLGGRGVAYSVDPVTGGSCTTALSLTPLFPERRSLWKLSRAFPGGWVTLCVGDCSCIAPFVSLAPSGGGRRGLNLRSWRVCARCCVLERQLGPMALFAEPIPSPGDWPWCCFQMLLCLSCFSQKPFENLNEQIFHQFLVPVQNSRELWQGSGLKALRFCVCDHGKQPRVMPYLFRAALWGKVSRNSSK